MTRFARIEADHSVVELGSVSQAAMLRCPRVIIDFDHYRPDGTCKCDDPAEQERMIREWGYSRADFPPAVRDTRRGLTDMRRDLGRAPTAQEWREERA
jgi:hypothetical protein